MAPATPKANLVTLTRDQIASILHDMGWEDEDVTVFWRLAPRETRDPRCLDRERRACARGSWGRLNRCSQRLDGSKCEQNCAQWGHRFGGECKREPS